MLQIQLRQSSDLPIEVFGTSPDMLASLSLEEVRQHKVYAGNRAVNFASLFEIGGNPSDERQIWSGEVHDVSGIGYRMRSGWIQIDGNCGNYIGARMQNGSIHVSGNAGNQAASEMSGGLVHIRGDAGNDLGAAMSGTRMGQNGGTIIVEGNVGHGAGRLMRRGVMAIGGDAGHCCGYMMRAGTIVAGGSVGRNLGAEMIRGTIILSKKPRRPEPGFIDGGRHSMPVVRLVERHLSDHGLVDHQLSEKCYQVFHGDRLHGGRGELLVASE